MEMPVAMEIGVNEWLLWSPRLGIWAEEILTYAFVALCVCNLDDKSAYSIFNEKVMLKARNVCRKQNEPLLIIWEDINLSHHFQTGRQRDSIHHADQMFCI